VIRVIDYDYNGILTIEKADRDLLDFIQSQSSMTEPQLFCIVEQIVDALSSIHRHHIYHLDLKLENVVLVNGSIKLIDFGMSQESYNDTCSGYQGTPGNQRHGNIPREVVDWKELNEVLGDEVSYSGEKVDVYALGQLIQNIIDMLYIIPKKSLTDMLQKMKVVSRFRYTIRQVIDSSWFQSKGT